MEPNTNAQDYIGEWVLVHVGFAMSHLDEEEAQRTLALLQELGEYQEELDAMKEQEPQQAGESQ